MVELIKAFGWAIRIIIEGVLYAQFAIIRKLRKELKGSRRK
tara:strand:+ start:660 stop:782 length:123 start_codon:yes stop_codon:yes gene_type:complete